MKLKLNEISFQGILNIVAISLLVFTSGCAHKVIQKDFDPAKKIQVIPVTKTDYIYAQNDFLINSTLEKELAKMSADWNEEVKNYNYNTRISEIGFGLQLLTLIGCIAASSNNASLAWCGSSIASAFLITFPFHKKAKRIRHKYITDYNSKF